MRFLPKRAWVTFLCGMALMAGCARAPVAPPKSAVPAVPAVVTVEQLVTLLQERGAAIQTMKALFSVEAAGGSLKGTQRLEAALVYKRPGALRLLAFARLGFPVLDLTLVDDLYQVRFPMNGKLLKGNLSDLDRQGAEDGGMATPIALALQATMGSLSGFSIASTDHVALREEDGLYVMDIIATGVGEVSARRLWFDRGTLEVVRQDFIGPAGELMATMVFQDYRAIGMADGQTLMRPYLVRAEDKRSQASLVLTYREILPNPELTPQDWGRPVQEPKAGFDSPQGVV